MQSYLLACCLVVFAAFPLTAGAKHVSASSTQSDWESIFAQEYSNWFLQSSQGGLISALGEGGSATRHLWPSLRAAAEKLPVAQKARLVVSMGLGLPFDGESAECFGDFLGSDNKEVAKRLQTLDDEDLQEFCRSMGYLSDINDDRVAFLKRKLSSWANGVVYTVGSPKGNSEDARMAPGASECESVFMEFYNRCFYKSAGSRLRRVLGLDEARSSISVSTLAGRTRGLPVEQKCRLTLLLWLALPLDLELKEHYGAFLGDEKARVGQRLGRLSVTVIGRICAAMGYPKERGSALLRYARNWSCK